MPLIVDVDGTLVSTDLFWEGCVQVAARRPWRIPALLGTSTAGKAALKRFVAREGLVDAQSVPLSDAVMERIRMAREEGAPVFLASGADESHVSVLAERVGAEPLCASDGVTSPTGPDKLSRILEIFEEFDYVGNSTVDVPLWARARRAYAVKPSTTTVRRARAKRIQLEVLEQHGGALAGVLRTMRLHQWAKNVLLFLPAVAAHQPFNGSHLYALALGFLAFSLAASAVYAINDLVDLPNDRLHPKKRLRPIAAGRVSVPMAATLSLMLVALSAAMCFLLPSEFALTLAAYFGLTIAYSFFLKRRQTVDVVALALLYTMRVVAGGVLIDVVLSRWFLAFSVFLFLSLALLKRVIEIEEKGATGRERLAGRGYELVDRPVLVSMGTSSVAASALVLCLYITSADVLALYHRPDILWAELPLLIYWGARMWILANRGALQGDPVVFAIKDRISQAVGFSFLFVAWLAA